MPPVTILVGPESDSRLAELRLGRAPRLDYRLIAEQCHGSVQEGYPPPSALRGPKLSRVFRSMSRNLWLAARIVRATPAGGVIYSTAETWGLPVGVTSKLMGRHHAHFIYAHRVYSPGWLRLVRYLRPLLHVDGWICVTRYQADVLRQALGPRGASVKVISQGVDTAFYDPDKAGPSDRAPYILSVGAEMRNYSLLFEAVRNLNMETIVVGGSTWMTTVRNGDRPVSIPPNVTRVTQRLSYPELRDLYAGASSVIVPLYDTPQAAGITTILEAMAMGKCVIATLSRGLPDILIDGVTGIIAEPSATGISDTIGRLQRDPHLASSLAKNGQQRVRESMSLERHACAIARYICTP
jgi:glycosyltransferase involved in cell wall biosynthesis